MFVPHLNRLSMMWLTFIEVFNKINSIILIYIFFLIELLRKPVLHTEPDAVRKLKMFYQTCISPGTDLFLIKFAISFLIVYL
jgi:hypothetical protein